MASMPLHALVICSKPNNLYGILPPELLWIKALKRLGHNVTQWREDGIDEHLPPGVDCLLLWQRMPELPILEGWRQQLSISGGVMVQIMDDLIQRKNVELTEQPHFTHRKFGDILPLMDLVFVKEHGIQQRLAELDINVRYLDSGFPLEYLPAAYLDAAYEMFEQSDPARAAWIQDARVFAGDLSQPVEPRPEWICDVAIAGMAYPDRVEAYRAMSAAGLDVKVFCANHPIDSAWRGWKDAGIEVTDAAYGKNLAELCASASVLFGSNYRNDVAGYRSDRMWLVSGQRGLYLGPEIAQASFSLDLPRWRTITEAVDLAKELIDDEDRRHELILKAHETTLAGNLVDDRCMEVMSVVGGPLERSRRRSVAVQTLAEPTQEEAPVENAPERPQAAPGRPRILGVVRTFGTSYGGGELSMRRFYEALHDSGFDVKVLYRRLTASEGMDWLTTEKMGDLRKQIVDFDPCCILCVNDETIPCAEAADGLNIPVVCYVRFWRGLLRFNNDLWPALDEEQITEEMVYPGAREALGRMARLVSNSDFSAKILAQAADCDVSDVTVVKPPIPAERVVCATTVPVRERPLIVSVSAQIAKGGLIFARLAKRNQHLDFLMLAGGLTDKDTAQVQSTVRGVRNLTVIDDWVNDMRPIYQNARAMFIGTMSAETYCRSAAEALANGIPVLTTGAGNLRRMIQDGENGVVLGRGATLDEWQAGLDRVLELEPEPDLKWLSDDSAMIPEIADQVRRLADVALLISGGRGVEAAVRQAGDVLGVTVLERATTPALASEYPLVVVSGQVPAAFTDPKACATRVCFWWHSHLAQMDSSRKETGAWLDAIAASATRYQRYLAVTYQGDALFWERTAGHPVRFLPVVQDATMRDYPKLPGLNVFLPGPYGERKNIYVALAATAQAGGTAHVTGQWGRVPDGSNMAWALGCPLRIHDCPTMEDVYRTAGQCQVALMTSFAETFCYGVSEAILAGTPVVSSPATPAATAAGSVTLKNLTDVTEVASAIRCAGEQAGVLILGQRAGIRAELVRRRQVAREVLLEMLHD